MEREPTVWIVNNSGHPYSKAKQYGNLVSLTEGKINPFRPDRLAHELSVKLRHAREGDFILLSGPAMANLLAVALMLTRFQEVNLLQWSANNRIYELRTLEKETLSKLMTEEAAA